MSNKTIPSNKENTTNFTYKQVYSGKILTDKYQRTLNQSRVKKIIKNFNPLLVNPIKVSHRDGNYYVFDGQHTLNALVSRNGGKHLNVDCKIYEGLTYEEEAELFSEQNGISQVVRTSDKIRALYEAKDVDVIDMKETIERLGINFDFSSATGPNKIVCVSTVYKIMKETSCDKLEEILKIILDIWCGENGSFRKEIVNAIYLFDKKYHGKYDRNGLVKNLKTIPTEKIIRDGKAFVTGGSARFARQILIAYNKGRSRNKLDDVF